MPIIRIEILEGRTPERKADLLRRVTDAVVESLAVRPEQVRVLLYELPPEHWAIGGLQAAPPAAPDAPSDGSSENSR